MLSEIKKKDLEKQGYRLVGNHSAIKICSWTKKSLRDDDVCYKEKFYDTKCHLCVQMTPALNTCSHRCVWCWRDIDFTDAKFKGKVDDPKFIIDGCIKEFVKYLEGYHGYKKVNVSKLKEISKPQQFAISLSGEPSLYPKLPELILELKKRKINSFLVTNGTNPKMLSLMLKKKAEPTQLYITLPAPNEETYTKVCSPIIKNGWKKIIKSLELVSKFKRNVFRLTLAKDVNMNDISDYALLIKKYKPKKIECKAYMWVGHSKERLNIENMPYHDDIKKFAKELCKLTSYKIIDEKEESRVILLSN
jgi:tRNA wybutosine-synthesizing protein 1